MKILISVLAGLMTFQMAWAKTSPSQQIEQRQEVRENLQLLLDSVKGLDPVVVQEMFKPVPGEHPIQAATPAAVVIAGYAAAVYAAGTVLDNESMAVSYDESDFDFEIVEL